MAATEAMTAMPWIQWLDLDTELGSDGSVRATLSRTKAEHVNHNGHVNAPVVYGVAEVAGAGAAVVAAGSAGSGAYTVIKSAAIEYRRPARGGISAESRVDTETVAEIQRALEAGGRCDIDVDVELTDADGATAGTCRFVVSFRPSR
ncbi:YiiD C-terminal domain-containing protein [Rhodococcus spongiicola]|uniref:YiiD C-terminal domain-containing protein n=1 Tax=Rhodococcus spongiicola TaxID=2487352 RepID=UPI0013E29B1E|nr:YiiD C-terminal domain-containing protein [Rhodococcus spongiicola]